MQRRLLSASFGAIFAILPVEGAQAQTVQELQAQIDELKATIAEMKAAQKGKASPGPAPTPPASVAVAAAPTTAPRAEQPTVAIAAVEKPAKQQWYDRIAIRGYTQLRFNEIISGDRRAPDGISRLRSVGDGGIGDDTNFTFRRIRLILRQ